LNSEIKVLLQNLVFLLVSSKYSEIVGRGENGRLSVDEIETAINDYPGKLTAPPNEAYDSAFVYEVYDKTSEARKVEFDLWYDNEPSDLTLSVDVHKDSNGVLTVSIDDIHVL